MKVWAVANQKGGVGKTTTTITLAGLLSLRGYRTLMIDMDPHGSLTSYSGYDPDTIEDSVYSLFQNPDVMIASVIKRTKFDRLFLLPSSTAIATLDRQLGAQGGMGLILSRTLKRISSRFDYVLIDCPPMLGVLMVNALAACDHLVIPVQTEFLALKGLERMMRTLKMIMRSRNIPVPHTILPTMFDRRTRASQQSLQFLQERYSVELSEAIIPIDTQFREASRAGLPLPMMAPDARGVGAYTSLLDSLMGHNPTGVVVREQALRMVGSL
ncbi:MAG: ParA family protein [Gammaproteobacteria bacterium]